MGCNCGQKAVTFTWIGPNGEQPVMRSEIEAKAKVIRAGGTYTVK